MRKTHPKKPLVIYVLKYLETFTDKEHPITQTALSKIISELHPCDRKTVGRNIKFLSEMGYPISKTQDGFYMQGKRFTLDETESILRAVEQSPDFDKEQKADVTTRLRTVLNRIYR